MGQLTTRANIEYVHALVASANNTDVTSTVLDMQGYDGVVFIQHVTTGAAAGVATLYAYGHTANAASGAAITGATATVTNGSTYAGTNLIVDVYKPQKRYVYARITSGTDVITFGQCHAIRYKGKMGPLADPTTIAQLTRVVGS